MKKTSLFRDNNGEKLISRLNTLEADAKPRWGKMNAAQMVAHLNVVFGTALGNISSKDESNFLFRTIVKWVVLSEKPFAENLPTSKDFVVSDARELEAEKSKLVENIREACRRNTSSVWERHPAFGKLTADQWGWLFYKHVDHHFRQFGI